ncbi:MAG: ribosomal methyltransferase RsmE [Fibrobacteres bacterium]|nr:ribosomal methyltransferase RsmE [Fibrobacterota bacterium]
MEKPFEESWFHAPLAEVGDRAILSAEESHHLRKVLRVQMGRCVVVSNGSGRVFLSETRGNGENVELEALEPRLREPDPPRLRLVLGLLKGRDLEEPVEGLCQLAVESIHLVTSDHSQEFKGQDHGRLVERLRAKSVTGLKQAKKAWLTSIHDPLPLRKWRDANPDLPLVLLHPGGDSLPAVPPDRLAMLTGPEGGFSAAELTWLEEQGCYRMGLGPTRIRGTHAPLIACGKLLGLGYL